MERERVTRDGWPVLMSAELASRYLSVSDARFREIAAEFSVSPVLLKKNTPLWRKSDLDRLVRRLPADPCFEARTPAACAPQFSDATIERIAVAIAKHLGDRQEAAAPILVSVKDAMRMLGLGRTTVYRLISEGELEVRRIGSRTLVPRTSINAILARE